MRLIIDVPDELVGPAYALATKESRDYQRRYDKPGWGWTFLQEGRRYWVRGIKGGLSVSLCKPTASPIGVGVPQDEREPLPDTVRPGGQGW